MDKGLNYCLDAESVPNYSSVKPLNFLLLGIPMLFIVFHYRDTLPVAAAFVQLGTSAVRFAHVGLARAASGDTSPLFR